MDIKQLRELNLSTYMMTSEQISSLSLSSFNDNEISSYATIEYVKSLINNSMEGSY